MEPRLSPGTYAFTSLGTRQVYHVAGAGPVMITHSGGPGIDYSYLRSSRLEERFTMVYPEPAGTGDSGPLPADASYVDTYVDFLHALVEHLGVEKAYLLGHSHGGFVAQRFAVRFPERTAGLVLYSTSPTTDEEFWRAEKAAAADYPKRHPGVPEAEELLESLGGFGTVASDDEKTERLAAALPIYFADYWGRRAEFAPLRESIRAWVVTLRDTTIDYRPDLERITARTVIVTGRHDFICGPVWATMLHEGIAGSRLVICENSGHFAQIEEPDAFLDAVFWLLATDFAGEVRAAFRRGDNDAVLRMAQAEVVRARAAGDPEGEVEAVYAMSRLALRAGDLTRAGRLAATALEVAVGSGVRRLAERPQHVLAAVARMSGDHPRARELYLASIALNEELGRAEAVNSEYHNLAFTELHLGNLDRARTLFAEGRARVFREGYRSFVPYLGVAATALATADKDHEQAARMIGFTDSAFAALAQVPDPDDAEELATARTAAISALGPETFAAAHAAGAALAPTTAFNLTWPA